MKAAQLPMLLANLSRSRHVRATCGTTLRPDIQADYDRSAPHAGRRLSATAAARFDPVTTSCLVRACV